MFGRPRKNKEGESGSQKRPPKASKQGDPEAYARHKEDMRQRMAAKVLAGNEIGPLPEIVNQHSRDECEFNLRLFAERYTRGLFKGCSKRWAKFHLEAFEKLQRSILVGGVFAIEIPRGSGKSAMIKSAIIWAGMYGHCHFCVVVCAAQGLAVNFLRSIKKQIRGSKRLFEDFPEVCHCIRKLENKAAKCNGQTLDGVRTASEWGFAHIVFPTVLDYKSSGFKVVTSGITGSGLRGLVDAKEDGDEERVDLVAVDDFQTRGSARSVKQTTTRLDILRGDIQGMAGPGEKMSVFAAVTAIEPNDGAEQLIADPHWQGMRHGLLTQLPRNMELWKQYKAIQEDSLNRGLGIGPENEFYADNREQLDDGCEATWPDRFNPETELSAIQSAMNLYFLVGAKAFWAEYMNRPTAMSIGDYKTLDAKDLRQRLNGLPQFRVPLGYETVTVGVDIQFRVVFYWVMAWKDDFTGAMIDHGVLPTQHRRYWKDWDELSTTLQEQSGTTDAEVDAAVTWGLTQLGEQVLERAYIREDDVPLTFKRCHIDINWQPSESAVARFCRLEKWTGKVFPARGQGITNTKRRISSWKDNEGEHWPPKAIRRECEWMVTSPKKHLVREVQHWKSHWQSRMNTALSKPLFTPGSISFYGRDPNEHLMISEHLTAHYPEEKTLGTEQWIQWIPRVGGGRWDYLDCLIGAAVAASVEKIQLNTETESRLLVPKPKKQKRTTIAAEEIAWS